MTTKMTPPINARGTYQLRAPWSIEASAIYECEAIRTFDACMERGLDVRAEIYILNGLTASDYGSDYKAGANLITLRSDTHPTIYVPDTYIISYPSMTGTDDRIIASVDLGILKSVISLDQLEAQLRNAALEVAGVNATVKFHKAPMGSAPTELESNINEQARTHTSSTDKMSDYQALKEANDRVTHLEDKIVSLESMITGS